MNKLLTLFFVFASIQCMAQADNRIVKLSNPASLFTPKGYSHVAEVDLGTCRMLLLSGQVAMDKAGNLTGKDDLGKQTDQTFFNIKSIVEEAGGTMQDIVKLGVYMKDMSQIQAYRDARDKYINTKNPPASTAVQVTRLFREDVLVEIEATAIIPKKQ